MASKPPRAPKNWAGMIKATMPQESSQTPAKTTIAVPAAITTPLNDEISALKRLLDEERAKNKTLHQELKIEKHRLAETRNKLLPLLPKLHVSVDKVKASFESLCQDIEGLVDDNCRELQGLKRRIEQGSWTVSDLRSLERNLLEDDIELSEQFSDASSYIITHAIFAMLFDAFLEDQRWLPGMPTREAALLNDVVIGLKASTSAQGDFVPRRWRSEAFEALETVPERAEVRMRALDEMSKVLSRFLSHFVDQPTRCPPAEKILNKLVKPCAELQSLIKGSTDRYKFAFPACTSASKASSLTIGEVVEQGYETIEAQDGCKMETASISKDAPLELKLCVFPGMTIMLDNGKESVLVGATMICHNLVAERQSTEAGSKGAQGAL